jgi:ABC-type transporter Mla maintaining outer membrane lipid asymmetry ATPase subunit MlaF
VGVARAIALSPSSCSRRADHRARPGLRPHRQLILALNERLHVTSVVVTHDLDLCFAVPDRLALLKSGIAACGNVDEMRGSASPDVRAYFEGIQDAEEDREGEGRAHGS